MTRAGDSTVSIALLYPELLGTYGDNGNAAVLAQRLAWRGIAAEIVSVAPRTPLPTSCDVYLLGGGEDDPQRHVARELAAEDRLATAVERGAAVLAVCAGLQVLGRSFATGEGRFATGVGLLDIETGRPSPQGGRARAVGESVVEPRPSLGLPMLVGFENHGGLTTLRADAQPLGTVRVGIGNGTSDRAEGVVSGRVVGTYLHGPVLALNPALADLLLGWVVGELPPLPDESVDETAEHARRVRFDQAGLSADGLRPAPLMPLGW